MELHIPGIIRKNAVDFAVKLRDISKSGLSCYTDRTLYEGTLLEIMIADRPYTAQVVRHFPPEDRNRKEIGVGLRFLDDILQSDIAQPLVGFIDSLPLYRDGKLWPNNHEQRRHPRKPLDEQVIARETCPKLIDNDFSLFHHGLTCHVDQYVPLFREIEITISCGSRDDNCKFSGIVVECGKVSDGDYCLEIFCPTCERDNFKALVSAN
ncbi:MAG: PilZ domain-containing protein [Candidatus Auribacterota bacterium]|jgi:hypothetical protein|nr:PilZ domain-containing protein [Candidatus Auribacterota bacterium]